MGRVGRHVACHVDPRVSHVCPVYHHNHKDHLGKFDEKADDGYFIGYSLVSKPFKFIEPYERPEPIVTEAGASLDQNDQSDQNDQNDQNNHLVQTKKILNDDQSEHLNHTNDKHIIYNLPNTEDDQITKPQSSSTRDASAPNVVSTIKTVSPSSITSMATPSPQN
ncbi:hypothetical protein Tco_0871333 [Tanacetum coccineum]